MKKDRFKVKLDNHKGIHEFCGICQKFDCNIDVVQGKCEIDAKSLMGLFVLNMNEPISIHVITNNDRELQSFREAIKDYLIQ